MRIRNAVPEELASIVQLRFELWPEDREDHVEELEDHFDGEPCHIDQVIVAEDDDATLAGFAELRIRNYAEGSEELEVPFLEGWYVRPAYRKQGVGAALVRAAEDWARQRGFSELASNTLLDNNASIAAHTALGFEEVDRTVSFLKTL